MVFIVGVPRSGTSLVYKLLCMHPDAAYISNWLRRFPSASALSAAVRLPARVPRLAERAWFDRAGNAYVYSSRRSLLRRAVPMPVEGEPVFDRARSDAGGSEEGEAYAEGLRRAFARILRFSGGDVVLSKCIANNHRIPVLRRAFPGARFVHVIRDGRDVALSLARVDWWESSVVRWYGGTPEQWRREGNDPIDLCARTWVEELRVVEAALAEVPTDDVLTVRYEELLRRPGPVADDLRSFAGLPESPQWQERVAALGIGADERTRPADERVAAIQAVQRDTLARLGYIGAP